MSGDVKIANVRLDDVRVHSHNVRRDLGDLRTLVESIVRYGVMQPIVVEHRGDHFRIRAGHRRFAAARIAGLTRVPAVIHGEALNDSEWLVHAVQENVIRKGLSIEERRDVITAMRSQGMRTQGIADAFGVHPQTIHAWLTGTEPPSSERQNKPAPKVKRPPSSIGRKALASFVDAWRGQDVTAERLLDALAVIAERGVCPEAMPHEPGAAA